jgi:hypothetical protein
MSTKPKSADDLEYREITVNGKTIRVPRLHLRHPLKKGDAVNLVKASRSCRD